MDLENGKECLWDNEFLTQKEVAEYFRVVPSTVKNWREQGLLSYWQAPGSSRVLFYRDEIRDFRDKHTKAKKGGGQTVRHPKKQTGKPVVSTSEEDWRL